MSTHKPWDVAEAVLSVSRRVLLRGKPGTGKTYTAVNCGLQKNQKVYQITMTPETPMAEIRGHFIQKGGDFIWHDGPAMVAWDEGARLVINEIDRASEDVHSFLYAIMDDPEFAETTLPTGEVRKPKKGFQIVATMNGEPDDLPDALQDRLPVDILITDLHPDALERLPEDLREPALNTTLAKSEERNISIRMWMEFANLREKIEDPLIAAQAVFGDKAPAALTALKIGETAAPSFSTSWPQLGVKDLELLRATFERARHVEGSYSPGDTDVPRWIRDDMDKILSGAPMWKTTNVVLPAKDEIRLALKEGTPLWITIDGKAFSETEFNGG